MTNTLLSVKITITVIPPQCAEVTKGKVTPYQGVGRKKKEGRTTKNRAT